MINGITTGALAIDVLTKQQEIIASNLMHANTGGHRRLLNSVSQRFELDSDNAQIDMGPEIDQHQADFRVGRQEFTDRPLDLAIAEDGFFVYQQDGQEFYSRDGRVYRDSDTNILVDAEGNYLQGDGGTIAIPRKVAESDIVVAADGTVSAKGVEYGRIRTIVFEDNSKLLHQGPTKFVAGEDAVAAEESSQILQFQRELSNVQPVSELVALIVNNRQFDAVQKTTRTLSEALREYIRA